MGDVHTVCMYMALRIGFANCSFMTLQLSCSEFDQKCIFSDIFTIDSRRIDAPWLT